MIDDSEFITCANSSTELDSQATEHESLRKESLSMGDNELVYSAQGRGSYSLWNLCFSLPALNKLGVRCRGEGGGLSARARIRDFDCIQQGSVNIDGSCTRRQ